MLAEGSLSGLGKSWGQLEETDHVQWVVVVQPEDLENRLEVGVAALGVNDAPDVEAEVFAKGGFDLLDLLVGTDVLDVLSEGHWGEVSNLLGDGVGADVEVEEVDRLVGGGWDGLHVDAQLAGEDISLDAHLGG